MNDRANKVKQAHSWLTRLARDTRGNAIMLIAASLIPLAGMVGGGVDISRMYLVKTRLQHACDAGALAGRKQMGGGTWAFNSYQARTQAERFFDANIQSNPYGATSVTKSFTEAAGKVSGVASAVVPMTLMRIFGRTSETLSVTCDAEMRLPNTDVMFVLDTTGSMASKAVSTDTDTKIEALRSAVKCFYEIVARLDTTEVCAGGAPSGGTGASVQVRFGFVPYATNVNVGKLLPNAWLADNWTYQSREIESITYPTLGTATQTDTSTSWNSPGNWTDKGYNKSGSSTSNCRNNTPATTTINGTASTTQLTSTEYPGYRTVTYRVDTPVTRTEYDFDSYVSSSSRCYYDTRQTTGTTATSYTRNDTARVTWRYAPQSKTVSGLKNGTGWNDSIEMRTGNDGTISTVTWDGCIEERETVRATSFTPIPTGANDLNIDMTPTTNQSTLWGPALRHLVFQRPDLAAVSTTTNYSNPALDNTYFCPREARRLQAWPTASDFESYVDSLVANGNTYHDIGLIWGARFISPTGVFRSDNEFTPQGAEIERHLIFMTDGDTVANDTDYAAYGLPRLDRRQTPLNTAPSDADLANQVNLRFAAICTAVRNKNITLWVISFGSGSNSTTETRLSNCATPGRYFVARNSATLQQTFRSIADQISALRLTK